MFKSSLLRYLFSNKLIVIINSQYKIVGYKFAFSSPPNSLSRVLRKYIPFLNKERMDFGSLMPNSYSAGEKLPPNAVRAF